MQHRILSHSFDRNHIEKYEMIGYSTNARKYHIVIGDLTRPSPKISLYS